MRMFVHKTFHRDVLRLYLSISEVGHVEVEEEEVKAQAIEQQPACTCV